jgi:hypothetical protein
MSGIELISVTIQADRLSIAELKSAIEPLPETRVNEQLVSAQSGDPNTWILTAKVGAAAASALVGIFSTILLRDTVTYVKVGNIELKGRIKTSDLPEILAAITSGRTSTKPKKPRS